MTYKPVDVAVPMIYVIVIVNNQLYKTTCKNGPVSIKLHNDFLAAHLYKVVYCSRLEHGYHIIT